MYDEPSANELAFKALNDADRAELLLRVHHARVAVKQHPSSSKHYGPMVEAITYASEALRSAGMDVTAKEMEYLNGRLHLIAQTPKNGRREPVHMRLNGMFDSLLDRCITWNESALRAPLLGITDPHERYMETQKHFYNTDRELPQAFKRFMGMTSDQGVRLKKFTDADLTRLITRTQDLFADMGARMPHELARWYVAANTYAKPPEAWHTLFAANQFNALPRALVKACLHYHPEAGIQIETDRHAIAEKIRAHVQLERSRA